MRTLLSTLMASVAVLALTQRATADDAAEKAELEKFKGTWVMETMTFMGETRKAPPGTEIAFEGNKMTGNMEGKKKTATCKLNVTASPKHFDTTDDDGPRKGVTELGIYELTGDQLKICVSIGAPAPPQAEGAPKNEAATRPKSFEEKEGAIIVLKRRAQ